MTIVGFLMIELNKSNCQLRNLVIDSSATPARYDQYKTVDHEFYLGCHCCNVLSPNRNSQQGHLHHSCLLLQYIFVNL